MIVDTQHTTFGVRHRETSLHTTLTVRVSTESRRKQWERQIISGTTQLRYTTSRFPRLIWNRGPIWLFLRVPTKSGSFTFLRSNCSQVGSPPAHHQQKQTLKNLILGTYCRGGPPWPPVVLNHVRKIRGCRFLNPESKPRAATEGRPYSTFRKVSLSVRACDFSSPLRDDSALRDLRLRARAVNTSRVLSKRRSGRPACDTQAKG